MTIKLLFFLTLTFWLAPLARCEPPSASPTPLPAPGIDSTYEQRSVWLMSLFKDFHKFHQNPKFGLVQAMAKLTTIDANQAEALAYASNVMDFRYPGDTPDENKEIFIYPVLARFLFMFGDKLSPEQSEHLKTSLVLRAKDLLQHGTENHAIMHIASAYLFAQYFPDATWTTGAKREQITSAEMMESAKNLLIKRGRGFYEFGDTEMLSPTYSIVNIIPLLNLWDFAKDPEVKNAAEALIIYHISQLALNDFEGHILPPSIRQPATQSQFGPPPASKLRPEAAAQQVAWLLWGQNKVIQEDFTKASEPAYAILFALSNWPMPRVLTEIATGGATSYAIRGRTPYMSTLWGEWGKDHPEYLYRSVWRDKLFAVGGGVQRIKPSGYFLENALFRIVWHSKNRYNYLECSQPYWHSNQGEEDWDRGVTTPFQQMAVSENTAIVLFDIPEKDPWPDIGEKRWTQLRDQHYDKLLQVGQCRFPKSVDEIKQADPWIFLREGDVYIGVRALKPGYILRTDLGGNMADFDSLKSYNAQTGFVFEVGTSDTSGSFEDFCARLKSNPLQIDWDTMDVSYTNSRKETLRLKYKKYSGLDPDGFADTIPNTWINGQPLDYQHWPLLQSPLVTLKDRILHINLGSDQLTVNWQGRIPVITKTEK